ncbi:MAG: tyrosine-type recombinase/integrase [Pseudonocardiaceae bacterium]
MSAPPGRQGVGAGLLAKLLAVVRPEFRVEVYVPAPDDPVLGRPSCAVPGCDRSGWEYGLCGGHSHRWRSRGRPDLVGFLADPGPELHGRIGLTHCTVPGCRYGSSGLGLCMRHRGAWARSGHLDPAVWAADQTVTVVAERGECGLPFCALWPENDKHLFCKSHETRWRQLGRPPVEDYLAHCLLRGKARIDFRGLTPQVRLEVQYAVQCRHDQQTITTPPTVVNWAIGQITTAGVGSLLDHSHEQWRALTAAKSGGWYQGFVLHGHEAVMTLRDGTGWDIEYPRDVWRLHTLPGLTRNTGKAPEARNHLRFDHITQPWLRELAKRWARLRLSGGLTVSSVINDVTALRRFSTFLDQALPTVDTLVGVDRLLLERYLAWLATQPCGPGAKEDAVTGLHQFFSAIRQHGWDDTLPTTAVFFPGDTPRRPPRCSRRLSEHVMAQIETPANLDRWPHPDGRLITLILIRCGLRASDACTLAFDCVVHDGQGAPYLRYLNHKMRREAAVPIDEELETEIRAQQDRVADRWPDTHPCLFPRHRGSAGGQHPCTYYSYRTMLNRWLADCDIRDEHGQPARPTPHQWRHTFASRLINRDVPQEVVRVLLDHESTQMTAHYARITDQTVRRRWEQATKVNIRGERVSIDPHGPLAQAQWAKTRYGLATQTLPHGYCGLPVQKSCPHANACLTCPVFLTGPEFLPELREHRGRTLTLIQDAQQTGRTRQVEMNTHVLTNLDRMIGEIEPDQKDARDAS